MKKFLIILGAGMLWCNVGFAEVIKYECTDSTYPQLKFWNLELNFSNNTAVAEYSFKGIVEKDYLSIESVDNQKVLLKHLADAWHPLYYFNYATDQKAYYENMKTTYYNCKYDKSLVNSSKNKSNKVEMASMIDNAKSTCKSLGFKEDTEKFADCSLKLYSQSVELAAKQNQQVVIQGQNSGSNVMTIYDPVRDSKALIKRGQGLINGTCTFANLSGC